MGGLQGIPATSTAQESSEGPPISEIMERLSTLKKPYSRAPIVISQGIPVYKEFNFGQTQAQDTRPTVFAMGISNAQATVTAPFGIGRNDKKKKTRPDQLLLPFLCPHVN